MLLLILLAILFIFALFNTVVASLIYFVFILLFEGYIFIVDKTPNNWDQSSFSAEEIEVMNKFKLFFRYPLASKMFSSTLSGIQLSVFLWVPLLMLRGLWIQAFLLGINYFFAAKLAVKLNPAFFLHDAVEKRNKTEYIKEMQIVDSICQKIYNKSDKSG